MKINVELDDNDLEDVLDKLRALNSLASDLEELRSIVEEMRELLDARKD